MFSFKPNVIKWMYYCLPAPKLSEVSKEMKADSIEDNKPTSQGIFGGN